MDASTTQASASDTQTASMRMESSALMSLVSRPPTHVAKQSGSWFDPDTWRGGNIPGNDARVVIPDGVSVNYDGVDDVKLYTLRVDGELTFATRKDTRMVVDTFVVTHSGRLEIGTQDDPIDANVKAEILIADNGAINLRRDPTQLGRGLISHGDVQIHGQAKTSHLKVSTDPKVGDNTLTLQSEPINWQVGDTLVLTGTRYNSAKSDAKWEATNEDEEVTIKAINGNVVTLEESLAYDHSTPRDDLKAYVSNLSRNVVIASENGDRLPVGQRGHTMFMHSDDINIRYAQFKDLGRTDKSQQLDKVIDGRKNVEGRYAAHIHETGTDGDPAVLVGNVVDGSPGWGVAVHNSNAILENNVAYDINGAAFVTESGNEQGAFRNNISVKTGGIHGYNEKKGVETHDFGRSGISFWFAGRLMENEGNVAAGSRNTGMFYMHRGRELIRPDPEDLPFPEAARNRDKLGNVTVDHAPIQGFKNNEVLASSVGLNIVKDFPRQYNDLRTVLDGFKAWEVEEGTHLQYTSHYTLNDFDLIGSENARLWRNKGMTMQANLQDVVFNNMTIDGFNAGIVAGKNRTGRGIPELDDRGLVWIDLEIKNTAIDLKNFELPPEKWLTQADLNPGQLNFELSDTSDLEISADDTEAYVKIEGTKTDSLGTIEMPFGNETLWLNYQDVTALAEKGYYTFADGRRAAVIEEYISDRVTGETIRLPIVVTFKESWWTKDAPNLGVLDPTNVVKSAQKVTIPESEFLIQSDSFTPTVLVNTEKVVSTEEDLVEQAKPVLPMAPERLEPAIGDHPEETTAPVEDEPATQPQIASPWWAIDPLIGANGTQQSLTSDLSDVDLADLAVGDWQRLIEQSEPEAIASYLTEQGIDSEVISQLQSQFEQITLGNASETTLLDGISQLAQSDLEALDEASMRRLFQIADRSTSSSADLL
ncbi:MAG: G8 domain-containing protein [Cyanobacteria bacterium J06634_6]